MKLQDIERGWRVLWMRAIAGMLPGARTTAPPPWRDRTYRVLFVRYERIGDMIMSTGMIRALAQSQPTVQLDVLTAPACAPVLAHNPHVRKVLTLDRRSWQDYLRLMGEVRDQHYDVIVDGRINNPRVFTSTPLIMLASGAPYRIGVGGGNNDLVYNVRVTPYDRSVPYIEGSKPLSIPFGVDPTRVEWRPEIWLSDGERADAEGVWIQAGAAAGGTRLLVNLSASEPKRRWPDGKFTAALRHIRSRFKGIHIVVIGLPAEWESVRTVAEDVEALAVQTPRLRQALALVGTSDAVFTPDTSISHAASAFTRPSLVLLKRDHHPYAPYQTPGEIVFWDGERIEPLPYEQVAAALERVLRDVVKAESVAQ